MKIIVADALTIPLDKIGPADAVYADPPYSGMGKRFGSEETNWIAVVRRMEEIAAVRALSCNGRDIFRVSEIIGADRLRVCAWCKPSSTMMRLSCWPAFAWEPVLLWGHTSLWRDWRKDMKKKSTHKPFDWCLASPFPGAGSRWHPTPKPPDFAAWVVSLLLPRPGGRHLVDLFGGTCEIGFAAEQAGARATAIEQREDYADKARRFTDTVEVFSSSQSSMGPGPQTKKEKRRRRRK